MSDDSDDNEDILKLKRKNVQIEGVISEEEGEKVPQQNPKNKKPITKVAVAKKILRKKIVANKKTYFDNDGQVSAQSLITDFNTPKIKNKTRN